ncbi:MAG: hypothetical protein R2751_13750 [Bacteroidales bacterium]
MFSSDPTYAGINWERRRDEGFAYNLAYNFIGAQMNPEVGFLQRNDVHGWNSRLQYGWLPGESSKVFSLRTILQYDRYVRLSDGGLESMEVSPGVFLNFKNGMGGMMEMKFQKEGVSYDFDLSDNVSVQAGEYAFPAFSARLFTPMSKPIAAMINILAGGYYDGNIVSVSTRPVFSISSKFQLSGSYSINKISFPDRDQQLTTHVGRLNFLYMVNTKLSVSTFVQVNNTSEVFVGNFRLRYNPREGNDFYLVFNEYRGFMMPDDVVPSAPGYFNRALLLKYTHTFIL